MGTVLLFCEMYPFHNSPLLATLTAFKPCVMLWVTVFSRMPFSTGSPLNVHDIERIHNDGENVSVDLIVRLDALTKGRRGQFIAIALATNGRIGGNVRLPNVVKRAREKGVTVLDLSTEVLKLKPSQLQNLFRPGGHYSPTMNRSVAEHIAAFLHERGIRSASEQSRTVR